MISARYFHILDEDKGGKPIYWGKWETVRRPGMFISMAMVQEKLINFPDTTSNPWALSKRTCPACGAESKEYQNCTNPKTPRRIRW
jgi:hypothetical protein